MNDMLKTYLPLLIRQALFAAGIWLTTKGIVSPEQSAWISNNVDMIAGIVLAGGIFLVQLIIRPSARALDAAKAIDKHIPADQPAAIVSGPNVPDISIPPKA